MAVSPHFTSIFGREIKVPHLQNVPGRSDIEIHMGNYPEQTKGCIILGHVRDEDSVGDSDTAFFNLMNIVPEEFEVTVE